MCWTMSPVAVSNFRQILDLAEMMSLRWWKRYRCVGFKVSAFFQRIFEAWTSRGKSRREKKSGKNRRKAAGFVSSGENFSGEIFCFPGIYVNVFVSLFHFRKFAWKCQGIKGGTGAAVSWRRKG